MMKHFLPALFLLCGASSYAADLDVLQPFTIQATPVGKNAAVLGLLENRSKEAVTITGAGTTAAAQVILQKYSRDSLGNLRAETLPQLVIPAGGRQWFVPETVELRLLQATSDLSLSGREFPLVIKMSDGRAQVLRVSVVE